MAELGDPGRDLMVHRVQNIYFLALYRKSVLSLNFQLHILVLAEFISCLIPRVTLIFLCQSLECGYHLWVINLPTIPHLGLVIVSVIYLVILRRSSKIPPEVGL